MSGAVPVRLDREVLELLGDSPELLAIADAIAATQTLPAKARFGRRVTRLAALAAVVGLAAGLALVSPWSGRGGLVDRALAAIGSGEVIHVVETAEVPGRSVVDLRTGIESPVERSIELWFDGERGLLRSVQRVDGTVTGEVLETPQGAWTEAGRVYTCAWIAAHPVEATKLRVSCNPSGENGTTPRQVAEPRPELPSALAGFVTGYREALESGTAIRDGIGLIDGRRVEWLRFAVPGTLAGPSGGERVERVAVDTTTLEPLRVETLIDGVLRHSATIAVAEALNREAVSFARPPLLEPGSTPVNSNVVDEASVSLARADDAFDDRLLSLGNTFRGLSRAETTLETIVSGYGSGSSREPTRSVGVEIVYGGPIAPSLAQPYVRLVQYLEPLMLFRVRSGLSEATTPPGRLTVTTFTYDSRHQAASPRQTRTLFAGALVTEGVYVALDATSKQLLVDAARALQEVPNR